MRPTYNNNDLLIASKRYKELEVEDIIVFKQDENALSIKRIIAKGGDTVKLNQDGIFVNDVHILNSEYTGEDKEYFLLEDEVFVVGDNSKVSYDSRDFGGINISEIIAKI